MQRLNDYDLYYDGADERQPAHIYERLSNESAQPTALCGAPRPASQRPSQQGTRPVNPVCPQCERHLTARDGLPLNPPRRP